MRARYKTIFAMIVAVMFAVIAFRAAPVCAASDNVRQTDVTEASEGCVLVYVDGKFVCKDPQTVLDRVNEIRLEACKEGVPDPRNTSRNLTKSDYVPVEWSNELEWIAQTRAAEANLCMDHVRPNGTRCFTATYQGVESYGENLAWNSYSSGTNISVNYMQGIDQWYGEKQYWVDQNLSKETGHYEMLINPNVKSIGIGAFRAPDAIYGCVAGEFSSKAALSSTRVNASGQCRQVIEVKESSLDTVPQDSFTIYEGKKTELSAYLTSTYQDTTCPYVDDSFVTLPVIPVSGFTWKSADTSVAKVNQNGTVTGVKSGTTTITASTSGRTISFFVTVKKFDPREYNTDTDVGDVDGEYTFTGDGDWYGYESYLHYDPSKSKYVLGRVYYVTLPEDGRLQVKMSGSGNSWVDIEASVSYDVSDYYNEQTWRTAKGDFTLNKTSDMLTKGKHRVIFNYTLEGSEYPGKNYFYHKVIFKALSSDEKAAFAVVKKIKALDDPSDITLSDESAVKAARKAYDALTSAQKKYVKSTYTNKLSGCEDEIAYIKENCNVKNATITGITSKVYSGKNRIQSPTVKLNGRTLAKGTDYKLTYKNNNAVGKATVTITGIGKYTGSVSKTFKINPKGTTLSGVTAVSKGFTAKWNKPESQYLKQITGYQIQYSRSSSFASGNKTVTVSSKTQLSKKVTGLTASKKYYVRVRTYKSVNGTKYYSSWSAKKTVTTKK